jgi:hypothetical protein
MMNRLSVVLAASLLGACAPAHVVTTPGPIPVAGNRIRYAVRADTAQLVAARVISFDGDSLVFERFIPGDPEGRWAVASVATDSIARLQVHIGRRRNAVRGGAFGALVGGAIGIACAGGEAGWIVSSEQCLVGYTLLGAGTGLLIGALMRSDVWAPAVFPTRPPNQPGPAPGDCRAGGNRPPAPGPTAQPLIPVSARSTYRHRLSPAAPSGA